MKNDLKIDKKLLCVVGGCVAVVLLLVLLMSGKKTLTCKIDKELIEGFRDEEKVVFKLGKDEIKEISYNRVVSLNDFYAGYGTYIESLHSVFEGGYEYLDDKKIVDNNSSIELSFKTKKDGVVLDNLHIKSNSETDNTSLRYDIESNADNEKAIKVGDSVKKSDLKKKVESLGYSCK